MAWGTAPTARSTRRAAGLVVAAGVLLAGALVPVAPAGAAASCPTPRTGVLKTVPTAARTVALTFDDGPGPWTDDVLAVLRARRVKATFFVTGEKVDRYPGLARRIEAEGHALGNHTYTHPQDLPGSVPRGRFDRLPARVQADQLDRTTAAIRRATGATPCFFRGPGGHQLGTTTRRLVAARGMTNVHWSVDTEDWRQPAWASPGWRDRIAARATTGRRGVERPVVLFHDASGSPGAYRGNTVTALPRVIAFYRARGFRFTTPTGTGFGRPAPPPAPR